MTMLERMQPALRSLLNLENELRSAAQNALVMRSDEAKAHMHEARRHYVEAVRAIKQELNQGSSGYATTGTEPERADLAPTGPAKVSGDPEPSYEDKHPHAGNIAEATPGPTPTDDPYDKAPDLENVINKKRVPPA
jgi:hypothetical protein